MKHLAALLAIFFLLAGPTPSGKADTDEAAVPDPAPALAMSAAQAAAVLRAKEDAGDENDGAEWASYDVTQNGVLDERDVQAALWAASGRIPDLVKFVERVSTGLLGEEAFTRFHYGDAYRGEGGNYESPSVSVSVTQHSAYDAVYYVADIYLQDLACLATATPVSQHGDGGYVTGMAKATNAVIAINGDYYTQRKEGPIIRGGKSIVGGVTKNWDVCLLTKDGELLVYPEKTLTKDALANLSVQESWVFGPSLLDENGKAYPDFVSDISNRNPRAVIGYYAPGHYCFLLVDGRQNDYSVGLNLRRLALVCEGLGLTAAYNLDGGQSAEMATAEGLISHPYQGGRPVSDIVYVRELPEELQY